MKLGFESNINNNFCDKEVGDLEQTMLDELYEMKESLYYQGMNSHLFELVESDAHRVLEIGCAEGNLGYALKQKYGSFVTGIELFEAAASIAKSKLDQVLVGNIETMDLPFEEESFDYILLGDVLEHLIDPWATLRKIRPFLKSGGSILICIPNVGHASILISLLAGKWSYSASGLLDKTHLRFFTFDEMKSILLSNGFDIWTSKPVYVTDASMESLIQSLDEVRSQFGIENQNFFQQSTAYQYVFKAKKTLTLEQFIQTQEHLDSNSICFITSVTNQQIYTDCLKQIKQLIVPDDMNVEFIDIQQATSMTSAYNAAIRTSNAKYKVYLHQDVLILNQNLIGEVISLFQKNQQYGILGVIGAKSMSSDGIWWNSNHLSGKVVEYRNQPQILQFSQYDTQIVEAASLDGLILITQYDIPWREDLFTNWHLYDSSQCFEFIRKGLKTGIIQQHDDPWVLHNCGTREEFFKHPESYLQELSKFIEEYRCYF